jgi:phage shock protein C
MNYSFYDKHKSHQPKRRFYRSRIRSKLFGVCGGVADYFGWDVVVVRVAFVISAIFFTAPTLVAYFLTTVLTDKL